ncbi:MAG: hypothetical protein EBZ77_17645 [Chitinophagia bacterium]|nr:hypothetical protein [Chitinophagia bacterium]
MPESASQPKEPDEPVNSNIVLKTHTGNIYGTVTVPEGISKPPVVLLIAGSGPTDRNGNNPAGVTGNSYKMIADSLLSAGIACVRYDKRGIGESADAAGEEATMRFDDMVDDARGFIRMLRSDARFGKMIVAGHSEGALVGAEPAVVHVPGRVVGCCGGAGHAVRVVGERVALFDGVITGLARIVGTGRCSRTVCGA